MDGPNKGSAIVRIAFSVLLLNHMIATSAGQVGKSKAECQQSAYNACLQAGCTCANRSYKKRDDELDKDIEWSEFRMTCDAVEKVRTFDEKKSCMVFDPDAGTDPSTSVSNYRYKFPMEVAEMVTELKQHEKNDEGVPLDRRAFTIFNLILKDHNVKEIKTNCEDDPARKLKCLSNRLKGTLEHVTQLSFEGKKLKRFGTVLDPVMQLFPNLRSLYFKLMPFSVKTTGQKAVDITFIELYFLQKLTFISSDAKVRLHCAFKGENCLANPAGLKSLRLSFQDKTARFELYGKLRLPKIIDELKINDIMSASGFRRSQIPSNMTTIAAVEDSSHEVDGEGSEEAVEPSKNKQTEIFSHIEFNNILLDYKVMKKGIITLDEFKQPIVKTRLEIRMFPIDVRDAMEKLLKMEIEDKLMFIISSVRESYQVPFVDIKKVNFDNKKFSECHYGKALLSRRELEKTKKQRSGLIVIRGYHMTFTKIKELIKPYVSDENFVEFHVYVYSVDVDEEITGQVVPDGKHLKIFFVKAGTSGQIAPGLKEVTLGATEFSPQSFPVEFIHLRNCKEPDPVIMRALATCLMINIGEFDKASPSKLMEKNEDLSKWYTLIKQTRDYSGESYDELDIARTESAFKYLSEYILQRENQITKVSKVPLVSLQILTQNIHILSQAGRDLRDKSRHFETLASVEEIGRKSGDNLQAVLGAIADSKIAILEASKAKSESLGDIELKKQKDLNDAIESSGELTKHLEVKFDEFSKEVTKETENFKSGVKFAMGLAIAEAAAEAVNSILSIFSGGFNPVRALKAARAATKLANVLKKLMGVMKKIFELLKKRKVVKTLFKKIRESFNKKKASLSGFFSRQKSVLADWLQRKATVLTELQTEDIDKMKRFTEKIKTGMGELDSTKDMVSNTVTFFKAERTVRIGFDPGNPTEGVTIGDQKLATVQETVDEFKERLAKETAEKGNEMSPVDVFKWQIAKEHVTGMIDTTLSDDVPEATNYRTALLKLITTGETRTQTSLDVAALETKFAASQYAWDLYFQEAVSADSEIEKTKNELEKAKAKHDADSELQEEAKKKKIATELDIKWEILAIKLEMVRLNEEYCNAYYYFHLEKCKENLRISPSNTLDEILNIQNMLMFQSNQKLNDLYPPPQTFTDKTITFKKPKHCKCLTQFNIMKTTEDTEKAERDRKLADVYIQTKTCLVADGFIYPPVDDNEDVDETAQEHKVTNGVMAKCTDNNYVQNVIDDGEFIYKVDIDSNLFNYHERVRIDEVKVVFKGIKTASGVVEILAESTGVSEDKFKQSCFKFITEKWKRTLSYYSQDAEKNIAGGRRRREISDADFQAMKLVVEKIKLNLDKQAASKGVTFIDSGDIHKSFSGVFQSPTVFSTWLFKIPSARNPGLTLSGLEEIQLKFSGSFVSAQDTSTLHRCGEIDTGGFDLSSDDESEYEEDEEDESGKKKEKCKK